MEITMTGNYLGVKERKNKEGRSYLLLNFTQDTGETMEVKSNDLGLVDKLQRFALYTAICDFRKGYDYSYLNLKSIQKLREAGE